MSQDDTSKIKPLIDSEQLAAVSDAQALAWLDADAVVWSVVVKPYILVQSAGDECPDIKQP